MTPQSNYRFRNSQLEKCSPPEWFTKLPENGSWPEMLTHAGATALEKFGEGGDTIEIYEAPEGGYFIGYWDCNRCIANIFIDDVADYLLFRATYIAPLASLIMESEKHYQWEQANKVRRSA